MQTAFSTVVLGDVHGNRDLLLGALRALGFLDDEEHWAGGSRRLIQVGDVIDRGPAPLGCMDLLMRLQAEARDAGGELLCLLGNHEWFALRAAAGEHQARMDWVFNGGGTGYLEWAGRQGLPGDENDMPYPPEFYAEFGPDGRYGRWMRTHQIAYRVAEYVVVHAGWMPWGPPGQRPPGSVEEANTIYSGAPPDPQGFLAALTPLFPLLWVRDQNPGQIRTVCGLLGCKGLITGHTPQPGIRTSVGGQLLQIDVGMSWNGTWAALGMDDEGRPWALMEGREPAPAWEDGLAPVTAGAVSGEGAGVAPGASSAQATAVPAAPAYGPGTLVRLYRSADGAWTQYLWIRELSYLYGYPGYLGLALTQDGDTWTQTMTMWPCERIDRVGTMVPYGEVPFELLG